MSTDFKVRPLTNTTFGATVTGVKLSTIDDENFARLYKTWLEYALLIFPDQHLSKPEQIAFARRFGPHEFEYTAISNVRSDGSVRPVNDNVVKSLRGNMEWHCDSTYMPVQAKGAVFSAQVVPSEGGDTGFADMVAAYDALSPAMKEKISGLKAYHSLNYSQGRAKLLPVGDKGDYSGYGLDVKEPPLRPLVKIHPETGKKTLMVGRHAYGIPGLSEAESEALLRELGEFACQRPRVHHHHWAVGDVIVWDNRRLMHQATPWDLSKPRVMHHSRIAGDPVTEFAAGH